MNGFLSKPWEFLFHTIPSTGNILLRIPMEPFLQGSAYQVLQLEVSALPDTV